jgi:aspartate carbamoyltransferase catalytic subunit
MIPIRHLLGIADLSKDQLLFLLRNAEQMAEVLSRTIKKVPTLRGRSVINTFLEPSTRTRVSFELAAKRLSADAINVSASGSSISKGETLLDMAHTLEAMAPDVLVIRHECSGAPHFLAKNLTNTAVVNGGDGTHEHPTQALLDTLTLKEYFKKTPENLTIAIVGDILHSRVARSNILAHQLLGNKINLVGPPTLVPFALAHSFFSSKTPVKIFHTLQEGIKGADVILCLRMQQERMVGHFVPDLDEYSRNYGISSAVLKKNAPHAVIMHPGPLNRGVEITSDVADSSQALITNQVTNGIAVRMAVLHVLIAARGGLEGEKE